MTFRRLPLRALVLACLLSLSGCWEHPLPDGVVATVNGEAIRLRTVQAYMDANTPAQKGGRTLSPDIRQARRDYGAALSAIIIQTLAIQELQRRGIGDVEERARNLEEKIRDDYGPEAFDACLAEEMPDPAEWRHLLRGAVALQRLEEVLLEPALRVSRDEVLAYYGEHKKLFHLPDRSRLCFASAPDGEALQRWRDAFATAKTPVSVPDVSFHCTDVPVRETAALWGKDAASLRPGESTRPRQDANGGFVSIGLVRRMAAETPPPAAVYALIEGEIRGRKRHPAFDGWLREALSHSRIAVAPPLRDEVLAPPADPKDTGEQGKKP